MSFRAGEFAQWTEPPAAAMQAAAGVLVRSPNGGWAVSTDRGATPEGYLVASANGGAAVNDAATSGARMRVTATRIIGYL